MEIPNEKEDPALSKKITSDLMEKSAALKKKNNLVMDKLRALKKMSDDFLKSRSVTK